VGPDDQPKKPKSIQAFDISDTGEHVVTLYYSGTKAHIEVWDLKETKGNNGSSEPNILRQAYAHTTIDISTPLAEGMLQWPVAIDINCTGTQVTICTVVGGPDDPGIPFQVLQAPPRTAVQVCVSPLSPWEMKMVETICDGQYFALASYRRINSTKPNGEDERFWVTDGRSFTVFNINGRWSALYRLEIQPQPDILAAKMAMMGIHGRYFAWTGTGGVISIWDFQTGQLFSHVFTGAQDNAVYPVLSSDGSKVTVTRENTIQIHDTRTGIKLGVFKKGLGNNRYFEVVFGKNHFMAYNPEAATTSKPMKHNMRSLVRLRDMAIVKTIPIHEDYRFNYPQTAGDPVFTFCHVRVRVRSDD
jgi:WD40 repeat protein